VKKLPWLSLVLLFAAYVTFGWFLIKNTAPLVIWILVCVFTLIQALLLTTLFEGMRQFMRRWLRSDLGYFTLIMICALSFTVALVWFKTFGYFLVLISAEVLARLDLRNSGFNRVQSLFVLTLFSLAGLATGWAASHSGLFRSLG
jgi:hypothetical protein